MDTALAITGSCRRRRRRRRADPRRRALPVAADGGARRRHHRDRPQHHRRTGAGLPPRVRRRPRRAVQSGQAQQELRLLAPKRLFRQGNSRREGQLEYRFVAQNSVGWRTSAGGAAGTSAARKDRRSGARPYLATSGVDPVVQHVLVVRRQIGSAPVQLAVLAHQLGMRSRQPRHEPSARRATQMQAEHRHARRAGRGDLGQQRIEVLDRVGQIAAAPARPSRDSPGRRRGWRRSSPAGPAVTACPARRPCAVRDRRRPATPRR